MPRPRGGDWIDDEMDALRRSGVAVLVSLLTTEEYRVRLGHPPEGVWQVISTARGCPVPETEAQRHWLSGHQRSGGHGPRPG